MKPRAMAAITCAFAAMLGAFAPLVAAHGWLEFPTARHFCNGDMLRNSVGVSGGNGAFDTGPYGGVPGLCGDPFEGRMRSSFFKKPCEPQATFESGETVTFKVYATAPHGGFFEFRICDRSDNLDQKCFDKHVLLQAKHKVPDWHILTREVQVPSRQNPEKYFPKFTLPKGFTCERCVLQWTWWTAHNCVLPCDKKVCGFYADRRNILLRPEADWTYAICETKFPKIDMRPQMFRNCADIRIVEKGSGNNNSGRGNSDRNNSRRKLLVKKIPGALEEDDDEDNMSGAGMDMNCREEMVDEMLQKVNDMLEEDGKKRIKCSNRATGVASNFARIMCDQGRLLGGKGNENDNCKLAQFNTNCKTFVSTSKTSDAYDLPLSDSDITEIKNGGFKRAGLSMYECGDGTTYWSVLFG